jgi:hypothetical protein
MPAARLVRARNSSDNHYSMFQHRRAALQRLAMQCATQVVELNTGPLVPDEFPVEWEQWYGTSEICFDSQALRAALWMQACVGEGLKPRIDPARKL